jgi:hypothetical protein
LHVRLGPEDEANILLDTPIAPGYMRGIGIRDFEPMVADVKYRPSITDGSIALDGERELAFSRDDRVTIELLQNAFKTVNVRGCMHYASRHGLMRLEPKINA